MLENLWPLHKYPGLVIDIAKIVSHYHTQHRTQRAVVRQWSQVKCRDYQLVLQTLGGILYHNSVSPIGKRAFKQAVAEIVENSDINQVLEYDRSANVIRYRNEIPQEIRKLIHDYIFFLMPGAVAKELLRDNAGGIPERNDLVK